MVERVCIVFDFYVPQNNAAENEWVRVVKEPVWFSDVLREFDVNVWLTACLLTADATTANLLFHCAGCKQHVAEMPSATRLVMPRWFMDKPCARVRMFHIPVAWICDTERATCREAAALAVDAECRCIRRQLAAQGGDTMGRTCTHCKHNQLPRAAHASSEKTFPVCGRCCRVHYCSPACQLAAWPAHQPFCKSANETPPPPPCAAGPDGAS